VRRQDLYDSASERDSSLDGEEGGDRGEQVEVEGRLRAELNARLAGLLSIQPVLGEFGDGVDDADGNSGGRQDPVVDEFEFRLFSTSGPGQKVVLAEEDDGPAIRSRPISFYLKGKLSPEERERFQLAAVSADDVLADARRRAWGLEVPWRVTRIVLPPGRNNPKIRDGGALEGSKGRKRPGKKRRIAIRIKEKAKKEATAAVEQQKLTKEEHLREKKKRLNREKKLKRRQKEREKKLAATGGQNDGQGCGQDDILVDGESE